MKNYFLKITYSWGDEEPEIEIQSFEDGWNTAKKMAIDELETVGIDHQCENGISFDKENGIIIIHYQYDDTYCKYEILKK